MSDDELNRVIDDVRTAQNTDAMPSYSQARAAKVLEAEAARLSKAETSLRGLVDLVNKYSKTRDIADRKAMFALAKELRDDS